MTGNDIEALHAVIHGRVQGVGFRAFVAYNAQALGLAGFARNLGDGRSVEVIAEGARSELESLVELIGQGPPMSRVESVDASWGAATGAYDDFGVR